jgi:hypothetical protein
MLVLGTRLRSIVEAGSVLIIVEKEAGTKGADWFWSDLFVNTLGWPRPASFPTFGFGVESRIRVLLREFSDGTVSNANEPRDRANRQCAGGNLGLIRTTGRET